MPTAAPSAAAATIGVGPSASKLSGSLGVNGTADLAHCGAVGVRRPPHRLRIEYIRLRSAGGAHQLIDLASTAFADHFVALEGRPDVSAAVG